MTVTDANLLLGRLDPEFFFGGRMTLDVARVERVASELARRLKLAVPELAEGIVRVANANMERAIRVVSVERGHDPRRFALLAFGGAGGMHACEIAERLEIGTVIVPRHAGVLSALGMLVADVTRDYSASVLRPATSSISRRSRGARWRRSSRRPRRELATEGFPRDGSAIERLVDVRYVGQSYEITVPFAPRLPRRVRSSASAALRLLESGARDRGRRGARARGRHHGRSRVLPFARPRRRTRRNPRPTRPAASTAARCQIAFYRWPILVPAPRAAVPPSSPAAKRQSSFRRIRVRGRWLRERDRVRRRMAYRPRRDRGAEPDHDGIHPIDFEVFKNLFLSIAEEMGVTLCRTGFSPNIKERLDYSCAVYDAQGETIAQGDHMPVHLGAMPLSVRAAIDALADGAGRHRDAERPVPRRHAPAGHHARLAGVPRRAIGGRRSTSPIARTIPTSAA